MEVKEHASALDVDRDTEVVSKVWLYLDNMKAKTAE